MKLYHSPKRFYPGVKLDCSFHSKDMDLDQESLKVLKGILNQKNKKITTKLQQLFPGKELDFSQKSQEYPCPMKNCTSHGKKLKRHLLSKTHKCSEEYARSYESFIRTYLSYTTLIVKHNESKPHMCHLCKSFFEWIDSHLKNFHQLQRPSGQMRRAFQKSTVTTKHFLHKYFDKTSSSLVQTSDEESVSPETSTVSKPPTNVVATEKIEKQAEKKQKQKSIWNENYPEEIPKQIPKSSLSEIRLRGVFQNPNAEM